MSQKEVPPGGEGRIEVRFTTSALEDSENKRMESEKVYVFTNADSGSRIVLVLRATVVRKK